MANQLDELSGPYMDEGLDTRVINKRIAVAVDSRSTIFQIALWVTIPVLVVLYVLFGNVDNPEKTLLWGCILGLLPGIIFSIMKINAENYFRQLEQRIQAEASNIDNYLEQRVVILQNVVGLVERAIELDKSVMTTVAAYRSGIKPEERNDASQSIDRAFNSIFPQVENYPELKAHKVIADAMQQNSYLQREITAARTVYNSRVTQWNTDINSWPTKQIVAAKMGYTTRIPFTAPMSVREEAGKTFF